MPVVEREREAGARKTIATRMGSLFPHCGNPACSTGRVRLWRSRTVPGFEGRWACSAACMEELVAAAVRREMDCGDRMPVPWNHRVPMGLMLVEQGQITPKQLQAALEVQRQAAEIGGETARLGQWLLRSGVLSEPALTRALSAQWNCPVLSLEGFQAAEMAATLPRFLCDAFGAVPVRSPSGRLLYVAFSERVDRSLTYALERMTGLRVAAGIAGETGLRTVQAQFLSTKGPAIRFLEAASSWILVRAITRLMEQVRPAEARLVRIHDYYWLRVWRRHAPGPGLPACNAVEDLLATLGVQGEAIGTRHRETQPVADKEGRRGLRDVWNNRADRRRFLGDEEDR